MYKWRRNGQPIGAWLKDFQGVLKEKLNQKGLPVAVSVWSLEMSIVIVAVLKSDLRREDQQSVCKTILIHESSMKLQSVMYDSCCKRDFFLLFPVAYMIESDFASTPPKLPVALCGVTQLNSTRCTKFDQLSRLMSISYTDTTLFKLSLH